MKWSNIIGSVFVAEKKGETGPNKYIIGEVINFSFEADNSESPILNEFIFPGATHEEMFRKLKQEDTKDEVLKLIETLKSGKKSGKRFKKMEETGLIMETNVEHDGRSLGRRKIIVRGAIKFTDDPKVDDPRPCMAPSKDGKTPPATKPLPGQCTWPLEKKNKQYAEWCHRCMSSAKADADTISGTAEQMMSLIDDFGLSEELIAGDTTKTTERMVKDGTLVTGGEILV
jgi:hypothetical protein